MPKNLRKIVFDTSALISLVHGNLLDLLFQEFGVVISNFILDELKQTAKFTDGDGLAAKQVLDYAQLSDVRQVAKKDVQAFITSRLDLGEASCIVLAQKKEIKALISDDFRAMHQLLYHSRIYGFDVGLGAVVIQALVLRKKLTQSEALDKLDLIASKREWIGRPIYTAYRKVLEVSD